MATMNSVCNVLKFNINHCLKCVRHFRTSLPCGAKLFDFTVDMHKGSQSQILSDKERIFELQTHLVRPDCMDDYVELYGKWTKRIQDRNNDLGCEIVGSWTVLIGDEDEAVHLWMYPKGYKGVTESHQLVRADPDYTRIQADIRSMLRSRQNQLLLEFAFWPRLQPRAPKHIYELRSYHLKPGTMIEWGQNWAKGLKHRQANNEPVAGFFSNVGLIHNVHHLWAYDDMESRKHTREAAWQKPGWDKCVQHTIPLMRSVVSRILLPMPYSKLQ